MLVQAEVSLYPLGEKDLALLIDHFVRRLERDGLRIEPGPMSTLLVGESDLVFQALQEAYEEAGRQGRRVLVVKMMNVPET